MGLNYLKLDESEMFIGKETYPAKTWSGSLVLIT